MTLRVRSCAHRQPDGTASQGENAWDKGRCTGLAGAWGPLDEDARVGEDTLHLQTRSQRRVSPCTPCACWEGQQTVNKRILRLLSPSSSPPYRSSPCATHVSHSIKAPLVTSHLPGTSPGKSLWGHQPASSLSPILFRFYGGSLMQVVWWWCLMTD